MNNSIIINSMKKIRNEMYENNHIVEDLNKCNIYFEENRYLDKPYNMPLITLKTKPCHWLTTNGGCTTCGYNLVASLKNDVTPQNLINQFNWAFEQINSTEYPFITLTSAGSFMDKEEIPDDIRFKMLNILSDKGFKHLNFESRPEYLTNYARLSKLHEHFEGNISVGIGLESSNDFIRQGCLNKGYKIRVFLKAIETLNKSNISFDTYVILGKPFLNRRENIEDAVNTINFAFDHGAEWAILMVSNIQPYTLSNWLWRRRLFQIPSIWDAIEVISLLSDDRKHQVLIKGIDKALPTPITFSTTCPKCNKTINDRIRNWNLTGDYDLLKSCKEFCDCWTEIQEDTIFRDMNLTERYSMICDKIKDELMV